MLIITRPMELGGASELDETGSTCEVVVSPHTLDGGLRERHYLGGVHDQYRQRGSESERLLRNDEQSRVL